MKLILPIVLAATLALPSKAATLPLTETFNNGLGEFTVFDGNNDGNKIKTLSYNGYNYTNGLQYAGTAEKEADDWLFSPVLGLRKGYVYELTFQYKCNTTNTTNRVEWKAGTTADPTGMTEQVAVVKEYVYNYGSWGKETVKVSVSEDGDYYLGMHIVSEAGQGSFYFDQIEIAYGVNAAAPVAPTVSDAAFSVNGESLQASFDVTLPNLTAGGTSVTKDMDVRVKRSDSDIVSVVQGAPGATVTYTDPDAASVSVTYSFTCVLDGVEGPAKEVTATPRFGTPKAVENFTVVQNGNQFKLTWDAVTEATSTTALFIPSQVTYLVKCGQTVVADKISGLEADFTYPMPEQGQEATSFTIVAYAGTQASSTVKSASYLVGSPYAGEFAESFAGRAYTNKTWVVENDNNNAWQPSVGNSYSPVINPQDGDGGCLVFYYTTSAQLRIWSPILDLAGLDNPKLKFWAYLNPSSSYETKVQPGFLVNGEEILLGEPVSLNSGEAEGWTEFTFDVPAAALENNCQLMFVGQGGTYGKLFIDNISIRSYLDHNLAVEISAPAKSFEIGQEVVFPVVITNKGANAESEYAVKLYADDQEVASIEGVAVEAMKEVPVEMPFKVLPKYAGANVRFAVKVVMASDMDESDNEAELTIPVNNNDLACAVNLTATVDNDKINLAWEAPAVSTEPAFTEVTESFETWDAGATEPMDDWVFIDVDGAKQAGFNKVNEGGIFAAMVAESFTAQYSWDPSLDCFDGDKCLALTQASSYGAEIDNWAISPVVRGGTSLSFHAMTFSSYGSAESFDIMWSAGGTSTEDFTLLLENKSAPLNAWTEFSVKLPDDAKRFAIRKSGKQYNPVVFDSFKFTAMSEPAVLTGFNVYRDNALIATCGSETLSYVDELSVARTNYSYHVTALYDKGESAYSNEATATIQVSGILGIDADGYEAEYFDMRGIRIAHPAKGQIVIVRKGPKVFKTVVR